MCGFVGFLAEEAKHSEDLQNTVIRMASAIAHRGPDDAGAWVQAETGIALGHRRLAIVDVSPAGHQPMVSPNERYVLVFNGEIYNHLELRAHLKQAGLVCDWRGHSDTETLLAGFAAWGIRNTVERSVGMFAFAVWDRQEKTLTFGRDRLGEKPLYYGWQGKNGNRTFLFGSELKALKEHPEFCASIDRHALSLLLRFNYIPAPYSIYEGIFKLEPGCIATVSLTRQTPEIDRYWSVSSAATAGVAQPFEGTVNEAIDALEKTLKHSIKQQMVADVPLGAFLSGGIDSSTVVALMQAQTTRPIKTFTIGFQDQNFDEAVHAKRVAQHLGTDHTELYLSPADALNVVPNLPTIYDEPFSDSSQIPTVLVAHLARSKVTVALSGDGGDELFCGYNRYVLAARTWRNIAKLPRVSRRLAGGAIKSLSPDTWDSVFTTANKFLPKSLRQAHAGMKMHKAGDVIGAADMQELYLKLVRNWDASEQVVLGAEVSPTLLDKPHELSGLDDIQRMMALDMMTYLPDDILAKVDRASMSASLEGRMPFLDHRVAEFAWALPQQFKFAEGQGKWILRQVLYRFVPKHLIERPKMGFGIPLKDWLRGPLKDWGEALLDETRLRREGYFNPVLVRAKWDAHQKNARNWDQQLWAVLMFQAWLEKQ